MKIPLSWIKEYIPIGLSASEVAHQLTMAGIETSAETSQGQQWNGVFVGKVIEVSSHPNADRLRLVTVAIASSEDAASLNTVVCGAPNVAEGQKIAFATSGAELIHPQTGKITTLKPAKIRGVESAGMVCSDLELGLGTDHDGIKVLPDSAPVGSLLRDYLADPILEVEITPNRPDCLGIRGIARDLAAAGVGKLKNTLNKKIKKNGSQNIKVSIKKFICLRGSYSFTDDERLEDSCTIFEKTNFIKKMSIYCITPFCCVNFSQIFGSQINYLILWSNFYYLR